MAARVGWNEGANESFAYTEANTPVAGGVDGTLRHGRESIVEGYYTGAIWRGLSVAGGLQFVARPGYNRDRGPVLVEMLRFHVEI